MFVTHCVIGVNWVVPMGYSLVDGRCTGRLPETKFESVFAGDWFQLLIRQDSAKALELSSDNTQIAFLASISYFAGKDFYG